MSLWCLEKQQLTGGHGGEQVLHCALLRRMLRPNQAAPDVAIDVRRACLAEAIDCFCAMIPNEVPIMFVCISDRPDETTELLKTWCDTLVNCAVCKLLFPYEVFLLVR